MSDKKTYVIGGYGSGEPHSVDGMDVSAAQMIEAGNRVYKGGALCSPLSAQAVDRLGACPTAKIIKPNFKSSRHQRESAKTSKRFNDPMHGALSRIIRVPDGKGGTKLMKMKTAIKKGYIKVK